MLANGLSLPIEAVSIGDLLLSQDPATGVMAAQPATTLFTHEVRSTLRLSFSDGSTLHTTAKHPFYVPGSGFVAAGNLLPGSSVVTHDSRYLTIVESSSIIKKAIVYWSARSFVPLDELV